MKFWCFHFEGYFEKDAPEYAEEGVFSSCLVKADNYENAEFEFLKALTDKKINLLEISENFLIDTDPNELDYDNKDNLFWIEWCEEVEISGKASFEAFNLYPAEEVVKPTDLAN